MNGFQAVALWHRWNSLKDKEALDKLLKYNQEDVDNLETLLSIAYEKMRG